MKSLKKTLVLLVVFSMILSTLVPAFAATDVADLDCEDQVTRMEALGVITGFEDGTFRPNETITRAQMAVIICKMLGINEASAKANESVASKFSDVAANEWYTGWINIASNNGVIAGFPDGTFRPNETLTLNQVLTLCVKALGRGGYVDKMGTWPANYVTEAARLNLLKDVKGASDANRGTVAVICWNTLNAATWYVNTENLDGEISLSDGINAKTLLAINFNEYTVEEAAGDFLAGDLKETEDDVVVASTPARNSEIGERQIILSSLNDNNNEAFGTKYKAFDFETNPKKAKKETTTYVTDAKTVVAYVPEEVCEDLDALRGHKVSVVFGEDNVVALIVVEDDVVEREYITAYDKANNKITVGETTYKLALNTAKTAEDVKVTLNDYTTDALTVEAALRLALNDENATADLEDIEKNIEATLTLDEDNKVEAIDLFVSASIETDDTTPVRISYEGLVTKVKETSKKYTIYTTAGDISWEIEDEEDEELPRVYVDGVKADIRDIEAGNVVTILGKGLNIFNDINTIYASTETVVGEATKVKKANNAITIDGTVYPATKFDVTMTTDELDDNKFDPLDSTDVLANDEITLYMNVLGEYVAVSISESTEDYTFGVVTFVSSNVTWEGDDEEILVKNIKIMLEDGNNKTFKIKADTDDDDVKDNGFDTIIKNLDETDEGKFVMVEANADNVIQVEDGDEVIFVEYATSKVTLTNLKGSNATVNDYDFSVVDASANKVDGKEFTLYGTTNTATCTNNTVIFNIATGNEEIVPKWSSIVEGKTQMKTAKTFAIFEDKDDEALYVVVELDDYASSDAEYAIVDSKLQEVEDEEYRIDFVGEADVEVKSTLVDYLKNIKGWFIKYTMSSDKVDSAKKLIDLDEFATLEDDEEVVIGENGVIANPAETKYELASVLANGGYTKAHLEVDEISIDTDYAAIKYVDEIENVGGFYTKDTSNNYAKADEYVEGTDYYSLVENAVEFVDSVTYYTKNTDGTVYTKADEYVEGTKYYTITFAEVTGSDEKAASGITYYTKADGADVYTKATVTVGTTVVTGMYTVSVNEAEYTVVISDVKTSYKKADGTYTVATDIADVDCALVATKLDSADTLGKVRLDDENLVVIDLREGEIARISLSDLVDEEGKLVDTGIYAVLYKDADCDSTRPANVVIILD